MMRVISLTVVIGLACRGACGQAIDSKTSFEVASIKPAPPPEMGRMMVGMRGGPGTADPTRVTFTNFSLSNLISQAYDLKRFQLNAPNWLDNERFDINAKVPEGATREQIRRG